MGGDHVDGSRDLYTIVHGGEHEGLGAAAGGAGAADAVGVHTVQGAEEVNRPDGVPELEAHHADAPEVLHKTAEAPVDDLVAVVVADHVVREDGVSLAGEVDAAAGDRSQVRVFKAAGFPVAMRTDDAGGGPFLAEGPVEVTADEESGEGFKVGLFDGVPLAFDTAADPGFEQCLFREWIEAQGDEDVLPDVGGSGFPFLKGRIGAQGPGGMHVARFGQTGVRQGIGFCVEDAGDLETAGRVEVPAGGEGDGADRGRVCGFVGFKVDPDMPALFQIDPAGPGPGEETGPAAGMGRWKRTARKGRPDVAALFGPDPEGVGVGGVDCDAVADEMEDLVVVVEVGHGLLSGEGIAQSAQGIMKTLNGKGHPHAVRGMPAKPGSFRSPRPPSRTLWITRLAPVFPFPYIMLPERF